MADRNVHQEWSFEAQWTWTTGEGGGDSSPPVGPPQPQPPPSNKDPPPAPDHQPGVSRVYRDGSSEIQMEYSWKKQPPKPCRHPTAQQSQPPPSPSPTADGSSSRQYRQPPTPNFDRPRPHSCHLPSERAQDEEEQQQQHQQMEDHGRVATSTPVRRLRPTNLDTESAGPRVAPRGTNGRTHHHHHSSLMGDSGYGSSVYSELSSPMQQQQQQYGSKIDTPSGAEEHHARGSSHLSQSPRDETSSNSAAAPPPRKNGRCRSSCDIVLEENSGWEPARAAPHAPSTLPRMRQHHLQQQQPVFHGPNCECIVCHDMQVRFESVPSQHRHKIMQVLERQESDSNCFRPLFAGDTDKPRDDDDWTADMSKRKTLPPVVSTTTVTPPPPSQQQMFRSHFCTHVPNRRQTPPPQPPRVTPLGAGSGSVGGARNLPVVSVPQFPDHRSVTLQMASDDPFLSLEHDLESALPVPTLSMGGVPATSASVPWRNKSRVAGDDNQPVATTSGDDRRHYRYSYPCSGGAKPKPRVIHIDVYCTEDDEEESEDHGGGRVSRVSVLPGRGEADVVHRRGQSATPESRRRYYGAANTSTSAESAPSSPGPRRVQSFHRSPLDAVRVIPIVLAEQSQCSSSSSSRAPGGDSAGNAIYPVVQPVSSLVGASSANDRRAFVEYGGSGSIVEQTSSAYQSTPPSQQQPPPPPIPSPALSSKRPGHHVGPARNRNCACDSCRRYFAGQSGPGAPNVADAGRDSRAPRPWEHS